MVEKVRNDGQERDTAKIPSAVRTLSEMDVKGVQASSFLVASEDGWERLFSATGDVLDSSMRFTGEKMTVSFTYTQLREAEKWLGLNPVAEGIRTGLVGGNLKSILRAAALIDASTKAPQVPAPTVNPSSA